MKGNIKTTKKLPIADLRLPIFKSAIGNRQSKIPLNRKSARETGFSLIELLAVIAIMSLLMGLIVNTGFGTRPAGARQGAIAQLMGSLEEARMSAIEKGRNVYFGLAEGSFPDGEKQWRGYLLFREQTSAEKTASGNEDMIPLTKWETLPKGFYFDPEKVAASTAEVAVSGLPGNPTKVRALEFGTLGQVTGLPAETVPLLSVAEAVYNPADQSLARRNNGAGDFAMQIYRLTGRVRLSEAR